MEQLENRIDASPEKQEASPVKEAASPSAEASPRVGGQQRMSIPAAVSTPSCEEGGKPEPSADLTAAPSRSAPSKDRQRRNRRQSNSQKSSLLPSQEYFMDPAYQVAATNPFAYPTRHSSDSKVDWVQPNVRFQDRLGPPLSSRLGNDHKDVAQTLSPDRFDLPFFPPARMAPEDAFRRSRPDRWSVYFDYSSIIQILSTPPGVDNEPSSSRFTLASFLSSYQIFILFILSQCASTLLLFSIISTFSVGKDMEGVDHLVPSDELVDWDGLASTVVTKAFAKPGLLAVLNCLAAALIFALDCRHAIWDSLLKACAALRARVASDDHYVLHEPSGRPNSAPGNMETLAVLQNRVGLLLALVAFLQVCGVWLTYLGLVAMPLLSWVALRSVSIACLAYHGACFFNRPADLPVQRVGVLCTAVGSLILVIVHATLVSTSTAQGVAASQLAGRNSTLHPPNWLAPAAIVVHLHSGRRTLLCIFGNFVFSLAAVLQELVQVQSAVPPSTASTVVALQSLLVALLVIPAASSFLPGCDWRGKLESLLDSLVMIKWNKSILSRCFLFVLACLASNVAARDSLGKVSGLHLTVVVLAQAALAVPLLFLTNRDRRWARPWLSMPLEAVGVLLCVTGSLLYSFLLNVKQADDSNNSHKDYAYNRSTMPSSLVDTLMALPAGLPASFDEPSCDSHSFAAREQQPGWRWSNLGWPLDAPRMDNRAKLNHGAGHARISHSTGIDSTPLMENHQ